MLGFVFAATFALLSTTAADRPSNAELAATCELGKAILNEQPPTGLPYAADLAFSAETDVESLPLQGAVGAPGTLDLQRAWSASRPSNIFKACPSLKARLPPGVHLASEQERTSASRPIPAPGEPRLVMTTVFAVSAPVFDRRLRDALVAQSYACPGLCGGLAVVRYRRIKGRWVRWGQPRVLRVS